MGKLPQLKVLYQLQNNKAKIIIAKAVNEVGEQSFKIIRWDWIQRETRS